MVLEQTYYTTKEAAEYLKVKETTIRLWYRQGRIKGFKPGGKNIRFLQSDLDSISKLQDQNRNWFSKLIGNKKKNINTKTA